VIASGPSIVWNTYDTAALKQILVRSARILKAPRMWRGIEEIAGRARGTPRIVNRLLKRVRDYAQVRPMA